VDEAQPADGAPAEEGVDALDDQRLAVLQLDRQRSRGDADDQRAAAFALRRPVDLLRLAAGGELGADDQRPFCLKTGGGEAALAGEGGGQRCNRVGKRPPARPAEIPVRRHAGCSNPLPRKDNPTTSRLLWRHRPTGTNAMRADPACVLAPLDPGRHAGNDTAAGLLVV